ncbi:ACT domain-containing protein [uncultured Microbacterium sp.]|jgi:glycine cleavage system regulatory protein|uniref:glycine cleavage system protein R n=1 Tax=uncultured Microbacterium sp. TaxID=191216 RepID=UPI002622B37C|nr:ACT domain-containing protein [uncultured Microbacterium sp.]
MAHLVLTLVGDDRAGLVSAVADVVARHGGSWQQSELAELGGAFAGIVLVEVPDDRAGELTEAVESLGSLLRVAVHRGSVPAARVETTTLSFTVLGNDRPGIVRDVTAAINAHALSIEAFRSRTLETPMAGGTLFEANVSVSLPATHDAEELTRALEALAGEIQVDFALT